MEFRIAELDELHPLLWLDDENPPLRDRSIGQWYAPDGTMLPGDLQEQAIEFSRLQLEPGSLTRAIIALEAGRLIIVSTTYLGLDHNFSSQPGPAIIWETMIFADVLFGDYMWRYATRAAAMDNHRRVVEIICRHTGASVAEESNESL